MACVMREGALASIPRAEGALANAVETMPAVSSRVTQTNDASGGETNRRMEYLLGMDEPKLWCLGRNAVSRGRACNCLMSWLGHSKLSALHEPKCYFSRNG